MLFVEYLIGIPLAVFVVGLILKYPYWGHILLFASLPIQALYPSVPFLSSILTFLGLFTFAGYLIQDKNKRNVSRATLRSQYLFALLFILWITITHPQAAIFSQDRNWLLTYIQLFILMWLASKLLNPERHNLLMQVYLYFAFVSAVMAIGGGRIGNTFSNTIRATGFAGNANEEALYLIVGVIFWFHLYLDEHAFKSFAGKLLYLAILLTLIIGVFETVSRTGFIALMAGVLLVFILNINRIVRVTRLNSLLVVIPLIIISIVVMIPAGYWNILSDTNKALVGNLQGTEQSGTFYLRLTFWKAALRMWEDQPIWGQGIGQFRFLYGEYRDPGQRLRVSPAHNAFISLLAETGIVGLGLYLFWMFSIFLSLWREMKKGLAYSSNATTWFIVLVVFGIFMTTGTLEYYKVSWLIAGISMAFPATEQVSLMRGHTKEVTDVRYLRTGNL